MSAITYLTNLVQQAITRLNLIETNAKKVDELPHQTTLEPTSKIPVSRAGELEHLTVQQVIDAIGSSNYNQLLAIGVITIDENDIIIPSGVSGQIGGLLYGTSSITTIPITLCDTGFNRKDILVLTTSNTVVSISGEETDGSIVLAPPTPIDAAYITTFDVSDSAIGLPEDPIIGTSFVKKSFTAPFVSDVSGADAIIPLDPNGYSEIRLTNDSLTSIAGFDLSLITGVPTAEVPYNGKPYIIRNLTGNDITIKNELGAADFPFYLSGGADLVFPNGQAIYVLYDASGFNEVFNSWESLTGIGTANIMSKFTASGVVGNSQIYDDGSQLGIGTTAPDAKLSIITGAVGTASNGISLSRGVANQKHRWYLSTDILSTFFIGSSGAEFNWRNSSVEYMRLKSTGLEVNGVVTAIGGNSTQWNNKLDRVSTVDVEKVYIKNADGTQGVRPISDISSSLLRQEFTFSGSQTFTLLNNYAQVYSVEVQGQGALSTSQYTLVAPNQITILDTLDTGDYVVVIYSNAISGVQPYYSQAETDGLLINKADLIGGLIPQSQLPSFVDDVIEGYLSGGVFYNEVALSNIITGYIGKIYVDLTSGQSSKQYRWTGSAYIQITNGLIASTNDVPEGGGNLYFTTSRVLSTILTGLSLVTGGTIISTDTVLQAFGKIQKQINDLITTVNGKFNIPTGNSNQYLNGLGVPTDFSSNMSGFSIGDFKQSAIALNHENWILCNGQEILRSEYDVLFSLISTSFGSGDGTTTFNVPDLRGKVFGGIGQGTGLTNRALGQNIGSENHILSTGEMPIHNHRVYGRKGNTAGSSSFTLDDTNDVYGLSGVSYGAGNTDGYSDTIPTNVASGTAGTVKYIENTGGGQAHNNMQPTLFAGNYFIKAK